jgi:hypothetical protein
MKTMNRTLGRVLVTALVAGAVAAALGGVSLARAGSGDRTLTVTEVQTAATFVNITHTQQGGPGDEVVVRSALKNADGKRIGFSSVICEMVLGGKLQCNGVYHLPGGTLTGTALVPASETSTAPVHIAITGGTGRYDEAAGQGVTTPQSETVSHTVIDLD